MSRCYIANYYAGTTKLSDLSRKAKGSKTKPCFYCPTEIPVGKGKKYCAGCSDIVLDKAKAKARAKHAEAVALRKAGGL